jgi:hypothetical protein
MLVFRSWQLLVTYQLVKEFVSSFEDFLNYILTTILCFVLNIRGTILENSQASIMIL